MDKHVEQSQLKPYKVPYGRNRHEVQAATSDISYINFVSNIDTAKDYLKYAIVLADIFTWACPEVKLAKEALTNAGYNNDKVQSND